MGYFYSLARLNVLRSNEVPAPPCYYTSSEIGAWGGYDETVYGMGKGTIKKCNIDPLGKPHVTEANVGYFSESHDVL